jgi:hypothetical protein
MRRLGVLIWLVFLFGEQPALGAAPELSPEMLQNMHYRVSLGICQNVATVHLSLKALGPGHYLAEFSGAAQGAWKLLSPWLPERYQTEMTYQQGRLQPLVFREEFQARGKRIFKEYRFDYPRGQLEIWRKAGDGEFVKKWQIPLSGPVYDPLSLVYNLRLGALGPLTPGETLRVAGVPSPDPEEIVITIGPQTEQGWKAMVTVKEKVTGNERGPIFVSLGPERVPTLVWTRVLEIGKLSGKLLHSQ